MSDPALDSFTTFGDLLKHLRQRARLTQRQLGVAVGYSDAQITRLESGQRLPDPAAVKARFLVALDLKAGSNEARRLVELASSAQPDAEAEPQPTHPQRSLQGCKPAGPGDEFRRARARIGRTDRNAEHSPADHADRLGRWRLAWRRLQGWPWRRAIYPGQRSCSASLMD